MTTAARTFLPPADVARLDAEASLEETRAVARQLVVALAEATRTLRGTDPAFAAEADNLLTQAITTLEEP